MTIVSNDEDLELFLAEFTALLNKYHYTPIYRLKFAKLNEVDWVVAGFQANGDGTGLWTIVYDPENKKIYDSTK